MVYRRLKTDSASLLLWSPASSWGPGVDGIVCSRQVGGAAGLQKKCIFRMLFKKKNLLCCRRAAAEPMGVLAAAGTGQRPHRKTPARGLATVGKWASEAVGTPLVRLRGRGTGGIRASSWPDPAAMCNDRAPPKKAPGREPGARGAECIIATRRRARRCPRCRPRLARFRSAISN